jgi:Na+-driven multidrug efflux pump
MISAYNDLGVTESMKHFIPQFVTEKRYDKVKAILFLALGLQIITSLLIAVILYL